MGLRTGVLGMARHLAEASKERNEDVRGGKDMSDSFR